MKRTTALLFALLTATAAFADIDGAWTAQRSTGNGEPSVYISMTRGSKNQHGNTMRVADFTGLSEAQMRATTSTPVRFALDREAGRIDYEGSFRNGKGAGQFTFVPNRAYVNTLHSMGLKLDSGKRGKSDDEDDQLFTMAMLDVSTSFIRGLRAEGYDVPMEKYTAMRIFNVTPEYIREMRSLGYQKLSADKLIETKIHGATPDYIREMRAAGWDLPLDEYVQNRIFKVTPEFAEEMKRLGYANLDDDTLRNFRIHGVTAEAIREYAELGYRNIKADDLVAMRIHRVTPEFIRDLAAAGYKNVPVRKLIEMRIHNIDVDFIKKMNAVQ